MNRFKALMGSLVILSLMTNPLLSIEKEQISEEKMNQEDKISFQSPLVQMLDHIKQDALPSESFLNRVKILDDSGLYLSLGGILLWAAGYGIDNLKISTQNIFSPPHERSNTYAYRNKVLFHAGWMTAVVGGALSFISYGLKHHHQERVSQKVDDRIHLLLRDPRNSPYEREILKIKDKIRKLIPLSYRQETKAKLLAKIQKEIDAKFLLIESHSEAGTSVTALQDPKINSFESHPLVKDIRDLTKIVSPTFSEQHTIAYLLTQPKALLPGACFSLVGVLSAFIGGMGIISPVGNFLSFSTNLSLIVGGAGVSILLPYAFIKSYLTKKRFKEDRFKEINKKIGGFEEIYSNDFCSKKLNSIHKNLFYLTVNNQEDNLTKERIKKLQDKIEKKTYQIIQYLEQNPQNI